MTPEDYTKAMKKLEEELDYAVYIESITGPHVVLKNGNWLFTRRGMMNVTKLFDKYELS
jgi:DNA-directed RNA polymerase subunit beta'